MRRLSSAAEDLMNTNCSVMDIALKYGYENPESFSRAFSKFHHATPAEVKKGHSASLFPPLSIKVNLSSCKK